MRFGAGGLRQAVSPLCLSLVLLAGCMTTKASLQVTMPARGHDRIDRLYIVVNKGRVLDRSYARNLLGHLKGHLRGRVADQSGTVLTGLELDSGAIANEIHQFRADAVLVLDPVWCEIAPYSVGLDDPTRYSTLASRIRYRATLVEARTEGIIWQAEVENSGELRAVIDRAAITADRVTSALAAEHLIQ